LKCVLPSCGVVSELLRVRKGVGWRHDGEDEFVNAVMSSAGKRKSINQERDVERFEGDCS